MSLGYVSRSSLRLLQSVVACIALLASAGHASAVAVPVAAAVSAAQERAGQGEADESGGDHLTKETVMMHGYHHVLAEPLVDGKFGPLDLTFYQINLVQIIAVILMFLVFGHVRNALAGQAPMGWVARVFSGFVMFVRDEMVMPVLGDADGARYLGHFLFVFFFITFMNLLGLVPHSYTATACIFVTGALAITTLFHMIWGGMQAQGAAAFWKNLIPHGVPAWLIPLMFFVELIGLFVKPFALMIRLFANMLAGHLVVLSFMGLIFYFAFDLGKLAYAVAAPAVGLSVFIMIIEGFVALLQAYIFTYLSILFVGMCRHPDH